MTDDERIYRLAAAVVEVYGYVPLSVRVEAAAAAMMVAERYFATPIPADSKSSRTAHNDGGQADG